MEQSEIVKGNAEVLYATAYELTIMLPNLALALLLDVIHIYPIILLPAVAPIQQFQLLRNFDAHACFIRQAGKATQSSFSHIVALEASFKTPSCVMWTPIKKMAQANASTVKTCKQF